ncbi:aminotransferase class IV, partial [Streptococcus pneumoniae]|nr:aminotransferase class IV [Streptococcus pneumoniae]MDG7137449.1 aminotransferase class IV [Streptococcus pneumoniae]MDG7141550.1 aminotransferase class IV [Streptococcus pneumoniae]
QKRKDKICPFSSLAFLQPTTVDKEPNLIRTSNNNLYMIKSPSHYINARKELYSDIEFDDILYVNEKENICELSRSNIFLIKDRTVYTPDLGSGILDGITRKLIIDLCQEHNILIEIKELNYSKLSDFDSAFCVGTTNGITPIRNIDKNIHFDTNNLLLAEIVNYYKEVFSKKGVEKYKEWFVKL